MKYVNKSMKCVPPGNGNVPHVKQLPDMDSLVPSQSSRENILLKKQNDVLSRSKFFP